MLGKKRPRGLSLSKHDDLDDNDYDYEINFFHITGPLQNELRKNRSALLCYIYLLTYLRKNLLTYLLPYVLTYLVT